MLRQDGGFNNKVRLKRKVHPKYKTRRSVKRMKSLFAKSVFVYTLEEMLDHPEIT